MKWCLQDVVFSASAAVPSSSQLEKQTNSLPFVLLGKDLVISPTCEVGLLVPFPEGPIAIGPGMVLGHLLKVYMNTF